jgi:D-alanine-D-alanine ligase-like ATP-grasp enzyme
MPKTTILIPDGESTLTKHVIHCLAYFPDIDIHVLSKDPNSIIRHSRFIKSFRVYDDKKITSKPVELTGNATIDDLRLYHHYDPERRSAIMDEIVSYAKKVQAEIIFPVDEHIIKILGHERSALQAASLKILTPDIAMFLTAIDKWELSRFLKEKNIPHPATARFKPGNPLSVLGDVTFPVIIKPINQGNALGIRSFRDEQSFRNFFENEKVEHEYIVQPLINGYDIDCSVLCSDGKVLAYTIQKAVQHAAVEYRAAVGIEFLKNDEVIDVVRRMMSELKWSGVAHVDLRYDADRKEVKVIEINARYWGSLLGSLNAGVNFPFLAIEVMKGKTFNLPDYTFKRYFMSNAPFRKIFSTMFKSGGEKVALRDTSLYYSLRDLKPFFAEAYSKIKSGI